MKDNNDAPEAKRGTLPKTFTSAKKDKATFYSPAEEWALPVAATKKPEEREFMEDSGATTHVVSKKNLNSAELETMKISRNPMTVGANKRRSHDFCQRIGLFEDHGTSGQKPQVIKDGRRIQCSTHRKTERCPWFINEFFYNTHTCFFNTFIKDSVFDDRRYAQSPVPERSGNMSEELWENPVANQQKPKKEK